MSRLFSLTESIYYVKLLKGEDLLKELRKLLPQTGLELGFITGIGGLERAKIGIFKGNGYDEVIIEALKGHVLEAASLIGNFVRAPNGEYYPHLHAVIARSKGEVYAGHVLEGCIVDPFLEIFIYALPGKTDVISEFKHRWT